MSEPFGNSEELDPWAETTREWLEMFDADVAAGKDLAKSFWWRIGSEVLPEGVDPDNPRVQMAQRKIRESMAGKG